MSIESEAILNLLFSTNNVERLSMFVLLQKEIHNVFGALDFRVVIKGDTCSFCFNNYCIAKRANSKIIERTLKNNTFTLEKLCYYINTEEILYRFL